MALKLARTRYSETMCNAVFRLLSDVFTSFLMAVSGTQSLFCLTRVCLEAPKLDLLRSTCCSRDSMNTAYFDLHTSSKSTAAHVDYVAYVVSRSNCTIVRQMARGSRTRYCTLSLVDLWPLSHYYVDLWLLSHYHVHITSYFYRM